MDAIAPDPVLFERPNVGEIVSWVYGLDGELHFNADLFLGDIGALAECLSGSCIPTSPLLTEAGPSSLEPATCVTDG